jgi:maleate cis-trans isomerase
MQHDAWRGLVGRVTPTKTARAVEELLRLLPDGIGVLPLYCDIKSGRIDEFTSAMSAYEKKIEELASDGVDVIQAAGTPPFMLLGYKKEQEQIRRWEDKYGVPVFTSGSNQIRAMRALGIKSFVGIGYDFDDMSIVERYFNEAGFDVVALQKLPGTWEEIGSLSSHQIYRIIKKLYLAHKNVDGIYVQGGKIRMLDIIETIEADLEKPVLHPATANAWEIMLRLTVRAPLLGYGRLLAQLPKDSNDALEFNK